jgi:hypothetical protein
VEIEGAAREGGYFSSGKGKTSSNFSQKEKLLLRFIEAVVENPKVREDLWIEAQNSFSERGVVEIVSLVVSAVKYLLDTLYRRPAHSNLGILFHILTAHDYLPSRI